MDAFLTPEFWIAVGQIIMIDTPSVATTPW
jgi:hypothetical protein